VTEIVRRFIASLRELGFGARLLIAFLMIWTTVVMDDYRIPSGPTPSVLTQLRVPLMVLSFLLVVHSFQTMRIWSGLLPLARILERFAPVVVLTVALTGTGIFMGPVLAQFVPGAWSGLRARLETLPTAWGTVTSALVVVVFASASVVIIEVLLARLIDRITSGRPEAIRRAKMVILWVFGAYFACYLALAYNAMLDTSPITAHQSEALGVTRRSLQVGFVSHEVWWLSFRSWRAPGQTEYIVVHPYRDGYWPWEVWEGLPLVVEVRPGMLGLPWVVYTHIDRTALLERLVRQLPTAAVPRKELITRYVAEARWSDALRHAREHLVLYPADRDFVETVLRSAPAQAR
jgi:hypothetical protein